ncbi:MULTISPECIES: class I SAM-dependent methyltransferase [Actinomadura]|uniref:class I SAM-dependent methyltransferase n=1 Tax=Actinomadura TaxID=1988 RepID=UPI0003AD3298|nr:class I SAM-dependent methyltransferase [Actinomadura madurae]SPT64159.1 Ubiquinone/menaquinone biosynthesis methyltransferase ubiE [Actinomadura madurae]
MDRSSTPAAPRRQGHPLFARMYARLAPAMEDGGVTMYRRELLTGIAGRVLEVGAGTGANFAHYPPQVTDVVAVEPEPRLRALAERAAPDAPVPVTVIDGVAEHLAAPDAAFDAVVACLVLCSIGDRDAALAEMYRVLRPGGRLHVFEHVSAETSALRRAQRMLDATVWPLLNGGCHLATNTDTAIDRAGFTHRRLRRVNWPETRRRLPFTPHILGTATRPDAHPTVPDRQGRS